MRRRSNENRAILTYESTYILSDTPFSYTPPFVSSRSRLKPSWPSIPFDPPIQQPPSLSPSYTPADTPSPHFHPSTLIFRKYVPATAYIYMSYTSTLPHSRAANGLLIKLPAPSKSHATSTTGAPCVGKFTCAVSVTASPAATSTLSLPFCSRDTTACTPPRVSASDETTTCPPFSMPYPVLSDGVCLSSTHSLSSAVAC